MHTQVYNGVSDTKRFKEHADKCSPMLNSPLSSSISTDSSSFSLNSSLLYFDSPSLMTSSLIQSTLNHMGFKKLTIRPFSVIEDSGLRKLAQECIRLGKRQAIYSCKLYYIISSHVLVGATYGTIGVNDVFCSDRTISRHMFSITDDLRRKLKEIVSVVLIGQSLIICPDF